MCLLLPFQDWCNYNGNRFFNKLQGVPASKSQLTRTQGNDWVNISSLLCQHLSAL